MAKLVGLPPAEQKMSLEEWFNHVDPEHLRTIEPSRGEHPVLAARMASRFRASRPALTPNSP